jgi:hypothetical protein
VFRRCAAIFTAAGLLSVLSAGCGIGLHFGEKDEGVKVDGAPAAGNEKGAKAAGTAASQAGRRAAAGQVMVVRVRDFDPAARVAGTSGSGIPLTPEAITPEQQEAVRKSLTGDPSVTAVVFGEPTGGTTNRESLTRLAASRGAAYLVIYEQKTPMEQSGTLIFQAVFRSRARGVLIDTRTGQALRAVSGDCDGTLGGLTPLNIVAHPHVKPDTERMAVEKLADAVKASLARS